MHEYSITQQIIKIVDNHVSQENAVKVNKINLVVGEYSGYVAESIMLYFSMLAQGTSCEQAELSIETVKTKLRCEGCSELFDRLPFTFECPLCHGQGEPTEIGKEFYVKSIEIYQSEE